VRAKDGGINGKSKLADWLDREVFAGGLMRDVWRGRGMQTWINATDLYNGTTFAFTPTYFAALCSDLGSVRIADAVAASMAVPIVFAPIVAAPFVEQCAAPPAWVAKARADRTAPALVRKTAEAFETYRDPERQKYLHLVDGGVIDNLGLTSLTLARQTSATPIGPLSPRDAVRLRRLTFLVVDAEQIRSSDWQKSAKGPSGGQVVGALANIVIEAPNRASYDSFRRVLSDWERDVRAYRCALPATEVAALRGSVVDWRCDDVRFTLDMIAFADLPAEQRGKLGATATRVSLPRETIDALIAAGRDTMAQNPSALALTR
jgi:predicted acylesterase/phospholipase RssA